MQGHTVGTLRLPAFTTVPAIEPGTLILLTTKVNNNVAAVRADRRHAARGRHDRLRPERALLREPRQGSRRRSRARAARHHAGRRRPGPPGVVDNTVAGYTLLESHAQSPAIAALLTEAGLDGRIIPDIKKEMWRKAVFNCVINPTTALIESEVGGIVDPQLNGLKQQIIDECLAVAKADGVTLRGGFRRADRSRVRRRPDDRVDAAGPDEGPQDRDRSHERRGRRPRRKYGIACPVNAAMTTMIRYLEAK